MAPETAGCITPFPHHSHGADAEQLLRLWFPLALHQDQPPPPSSACQADAAESDTKKRRKAEDDSGIGDKAIKWAEEFDGLGEDDQYTYLEELAPRMRCLHTCAPTPVSARPRLLLASPALCASQQDALAVFARHHWLRR